MARPKKGLDGMRGRHERRVWEWNPALYAPPRYRRACQYDVFIPEPIAGLQLALPGHVAGVVSEAEKAVAELNRGAGPELMPFCLPVRSSPYRWEWRPPGEPSRQ